MPDRPLPRRGERGQASVELVALLPVLVAGMLACWQVVLAGHALWSAHAAARAAARADAVGGDRLAAARGALPPSLEGGVRVRAAEEDGRVPVAVRIPSVLPGVDLGSLTARAGFAPQR